MATYSIATRPAAARHPFAPDAYERLLSAAALALLAAVAVALFKGRAEWGQVPATIWLHIATIVLALGLTPVMLLRPRGDRMHRRLGWVWAGAMVVTALSTFAIRTIDPGRLWFIHILSAWTLIQVPILVWRARPRPCTPPRIGARNGRRGAYYRRNFHLSVRAADGKLAVRITCFIDTWAVGT